MKNEWAAIVKVGTKMKTEKYLEKTSSEQAKWATAENAKMSATLLASLKPAAGTAGADCSKTTGAAKSAGGNGGKKGDSSSRPKPSKASGTTLCCMACKKSVTDTTQKEVFGSYGGKCTIVKTPATAPVVNYYATTTKAVTEEWIGVCIQ